MNNEITEEQYREKLKKHTEIWKAISYALNRCLHYKQYNQRFANVVRERIPEYTVSIVTDEYLNYLRVWGNGLNHSDSFYFVWNNSKNWKDAIKENLENYKPEHLLIKLDVDICFYPELESLEAEIVELEKVIAQLKERAYKAVPNPSCVVSKRFPKLFS